MIDFKCIAKSAGIIYDESRNVMHINRDNFIKYSEMVLEEGRQRQIRSEQALVEMTRIGEELNDEL